MCGLVGIAGGLGYKDEAAMKRLFLLDYFRGPDSTGLAAIRNTGEAFVIKLANNPLDLFDHSRFKTALNGTNSKAFIGHNRAATRGGVNNTNAHPFECDHIIGAHNGTLDHASTKRLEDAIGEKFAVDSNAIFAAIAKIGITETIGLMEEGRESATGAWALVWYDQNEGSLNFLRNKHRPLWYAYSKDFKRLFWASEWQMIDAAAKFSNGDIDIFTEEKTGYKYWSVGDNIHMKFDLDVLKAGSTTRPKPLAKELKGREPAPAAASTGHYPFQTRGPATGFHPTTEKSGSSSKSSTPTAHGTTHSNREGVGIIHLIGDKNRPLAGYLAKERFDDLAKYGCSWCQQDVVWGEPGITLYDRDDMLLCPTCSGAPTDAVETELPSSRIYVRPATMDSYVTPESKLL